MSKPGVKRDIRGGEKVDAKKQKPNPRPDPGPTTKTNPKPDPKPTPKPTTKTKNPGAKVNEVCEALAKQRSVDNAFPLRQSSRLKTKS